jgi:hypothetical protein
VLGLLGVRIGDGIPRVEVVRHLPESCATRMTTPVR